LAHQSIASTRLSVQMQMNSLHNICLPGYLLCCLLTIRWDSMQRPPLFSAL
jgi:hypothetical protein